MKALARSALAISPVLLVLVLLLVVLALDILTAGGLLPLRLHLVEAFLDIGEARLLLGVQLAVAVEREEDVADGADDAVAGLDVAPQVDLETNI